MLPARRSFSNHQDSTIDPASDRDEPRPEYDLSQLQGGTRGKFYEQYRTRPPISDARGEELARRAAEDDASPGDVIPWEEVMAQVLANLNAADKPPT